MDNVKQQYKNNRATQKQHKDKQLLRLPDVVEIQTRLEDSLTSMEWNRLSTHLILFLAI